MKLSLKTLALVALATVSAVPASATTVLGSRVVADNSETDVINVPGLALFSEVRFCVANRAVHFRDVDVHFALAGQQDLNVRTLVRPGHCTGWFNLRGPVRNIDQIVLRYDALVNPGNQPIVTAFGR